MLVRESPSPGFSRSVLTSDDSRYRFIRRADGRVVVWAPASTPAQSDGLVQEGLAVRTMDRDGRVRAITLTKNTVFDVDWVFKVVTWDTARDGEPWRNVEQFDMGSALSTEGSGVEPLPWRVCRRVTGRTVTFRIWLPGRMTPPAWDDPTYARSTTIPAAFDRAGAPGWYVGHLPAGGRVVYDDLRTR